MKAPGGKESGGGAESWSSTRRTGATDSSANESGMMTAIKFGDTEAMATGGQQYGGTESCSSTRKTGAADSGANESGGGCNDRHRVWLQEAMATGEDEESGERHSAMTSSEKAFGDESDEEQRADEALGYS